MLVGSPPQLRALIRRMSVENPLWGAPRIHGELLKLGFEVAQSSVAKYMVKRRGPPSQGWRTFLRNHAPDIAAMDLFVVTSERIRDKIAASKRKGLWVGGNLPLGYEMKEGKIAIVEEDAELVRSIFSTRLPRRRRPQGSK
jgi:hypothetical protein